MFDELSYPPSALTAARYHERCQTGAARMRDLTVAICGLARDLGPALPRTMAAVTAIGELFKQCTVVIYENDSRDYTAAHLRNWADANPWIHVRTETLHSKRYPPIRDAERVNLMAHYRNQTHAMVLEHAPTADYVITLDLDIGNYALRGLCNTFGWDDWDAMASNGLCTVQGRQVQYDAYAWRDTGHPQPMTAHTINHRQYPVGTDLVPVLSAFGGMAVYRGDLYRVHRYEANGDCEHVAFHRHFPRMFVNPSQLVVYP
jgi:hypothetical protein